MDIRGLILVNNDADSEERLSFSSPALALLDVAGCSPMLRLAKRLETCGVGPVMAVVEEAIPFSRARVLPGEMECRAASPDRFWRAAESAFNDLAQNGAELVVLIRLGAYAEVDFERLIQFHLERRGRVSRVMHETGAGLEIFCLSASRRNDAASLLRSGLTRCRSECDSFLDSGYMNPLSDARDMRQLAIDVLTLKTQSRAAGCEVRPGIWLGSGTRVEKQARILAPAFVGDSVLVRDATVITRCTSVEHHAQIDCGTVVENCTVLPYTTIGAGLDLAHSVAGMGRIINLRRGVAVQVVDPHLLGQISESIGERMAVAAGHWPRRIWRGLFGDAGRQEPAAEPVQEGRQLLPDTAHESADLTTNLAIARRYGDQ